MPTVATFKDWEPVFAAIGLLISIVLASIGWYITRRQRAVDREEKRLEKETSLENSERRLFMFFRAVFSRPAFRGDFQWTSDAQPFKKAIDDTLLAIRTGHLQTRREKTLNIVPGAETQSSAPARREKMVQIERRLDKIRIITAELVGGQTRDMVATNDLSFQFMTNHPLSSENTYYLFVLGDLQNCGGLIRFIKHRWHPFQFLYEHFSIAARQLVDNYPPHSSIIAPPRLTSEQETILVAELNRLLESEIFLTDQQGGILLSSTGGDNLTSSSDRDILLRNNRIILESNSVVPPAYAIAIDRERNKIIDILNTILSELKLDALPLPRDSESLLA